MTIALTPAFRNDTSPRGFAKAAPGKDKRVMSVIVSDFQAALEAVNVDRYEYPWFILEYLLMVPLKLPQRLSVFRLHFLMRCSQRNSIT
jgi:hypothetical protein